MEVGWRNRIGNSCGFESEGVVGLNWKRWRNSSEYAPQRILQNGQSAEVLRFMAMLWVQDPIEIQKQYGYVDDSIPAFLQRLNFC